MKFLETGHMSFKDDANPLPNLQVSLLTRRRVMVD